MSKRFLLRWLLISLALHLLAAIFSTGYQNSDEHFQILEFLNAFLGKTPISALPIEYGRMMRPWFQPFLYWIPTRILTGLGVQDPFTWATSYRMLSALIGWGSVVALSLCVPRWIRDVRWQRIAVIVLALTWYLPALHARHSSENLSGSLFVIGLAIGVLRPGFFWSLASGLIWGFAFEARYQVGIMIAGAFLWAVVYKARPDESAPFEERPDESAPFEDRRVRDLSAVVLGVLVAIGIGTYLDRLGYGQWTFAPWNYFQFNLLEGHVTTSDVSPIWDYFRRAWTETWPLVGFLSFMGLFFFWIRKPRHRLTWSLLPLFVFHTLIGHKETRFLFPMMHAAPVCWVLLAMEWTWLLRLRWPLAVLNGIALFGLTFVPASLPMRFYERAYSLPELYYVDQDPYVILGIPMYFYRRPGMQTRPVSPAMPSEFWFAYPRPELPDRGELRGCVRNFSTIPGWVRTVDPWLRNVNDWSLYYCKAQTVNAPSIKK